MTDEDECDICGNGPMAGSGCPIHDPFIVLIIAFGTVLALMVVIGVVGTLLGY